MSDIKTLDDVREYVQKDYWEKGLEKGVSGYSNTEPNWWWNGRYCQMLNSVFDFRGKSILDLGCAFGEFIGMATLYGARAYGVDLSDYAIKAGLSKISWLNGKMKQGSIHDLKYSSNSFDFLHSHQVFEHLPGEHCFDLAREAYRVAKPGCTIWAALVLDVDSKFVDTGTNPEDFDKSHINLRTCDWWDERFLSAGWLKDTEFDKKLRTILVEPDRYSFFKEYGWHSICYKKKG